METRGVDIGDLVRKGAKMIKIDVHRYVYEHHDLQRCMSPATRRGIVEGKSLHKKSTDGHSLIKF